MCRRVTGAPAMSFVPFRSCVAHSQPFGSPHPKETFEYNRFCLRPVIFFSFIPNRTHAPCARDLRNARPAISISVEKERTGGAARGLTAQAFLSARPSVTSRHTLHPREGTLAAHCARARDAKNNRVRSAQAGVVASRRYQESRQALPLTFPSSPTLRQTHARKRCTECSLTRP